MKTKAEIINLIIGSVKKDELLEKCIKGDVQFIENLIKQYSEITEKSVYFKKQINTTKIIKIDRIYFKPEDSSKFLNNIKPLIDKGLKNISDIKEYLGFWVDEMTIWCDEVSIEHSSSLNNSIQFNLCKNIPLIFIIDKRHKFKKSDKEDSIENSNLISSNISLFINNTRELINELF